MRAPMLLLLTAVLIARPQLLLRQNTIMHLQLLMQNGSMLMPGAQQ